MMCNRGYFSHVVGMVITKINQIRAIWIRSGGVCSVNFEK